MIEYPSLVAGFVMASFFPDQESVGRPLPGVGASILLVNKDPRVLSRYGTVLRRVGCQVCASLSFAEGARCLEREPYDLVLLDQGSDGFEGREVLVRAMEIDPELRVLVLARSHEDGCYLEAMQSGALDYLAEPLSAADMVALLETFIPRRSRSHRTSQCPTKAAKPNKKRTNKTGSTKVQSKMIGACRETLKNLGGAFRRGHPGSGILDSCRTQS